MYCGCSDQIARASASDIRKNGTQAARDAGYQGSDNVLAVTAHELLKDLRIQKRIQELSTTINAVPPAGEFNHLLSCREVLGIASFLASATLDMVLDEQGKFDINKARETG